MILVIAVIAPCSLSDVAYSKNSFVKSLCWDVVYDKT